MLQENLLETPLQLIVGVQYWSKGCFHQRAWGLEKQFHVHVDAIPQEARKWL
jgi:hypothetical protein